MGEGKMKRILFTLCILVAFITSAYAGEMYSCIDRNGNSIITDAPQDGMTNCALKDSYNDPTPYEKAQWERKKEEGRARDREEQAQRHKCNLITKDMSQLNVKKILGTPFHTEVFPWGDYGNGAYDEHWTYTNGGKEDCTIVFLCFASKCSVTKVKRQ